VADVEIVIDVGTVALGLLAESGTLSPFSGAGPSITTVPVTVSPATTNPELSSTLVGLGILIVSIADRDTLPSVAATSIVWSNPTGDVVIGTATDNVPGGTCAVVGMPISDDVPITRTDPSASVPTVNADSCTVTPVPAGAGPDSVIVAVAPVPPTTALGAIEIATSDAGFSVSVAVV
jgi:hypothetical protein